MARGHTRHPKRLRVLALCLQGELVISTAQEGLLRIRSQPLECNSRDVSTQRGHASSQESATVHGILKSAKL
eukprot:7313991-Pyramimonas_sp.AAC.1